MRGQNVRGVGGCLQSKFFSVVLGAVEAAASKRACSTALSLTGHGSSVGTAEDGVARSGRLLDKRGNVCVRHDSDGAWDEEEQARIRQDVPSIAEEDDRTTILDSNAAGPSP